MSCDILAQVSHDPKVAVVFWWVTTYERDSGITPWGDHGGAYGCSSLASCGDAGFPAMRQTAAGGGKEL